MTVEVKVPDIGDFNEVPVVTVLVSVGDTIAVEDPIVELESDKATMEVPSSAAGVVKEIKVSEGDKRNEAQNVGCTETREIDRDRDIRAWYPRRSENQLCRSRWLCAGLAGPPYPAW